MVLSVLNSHPRYSMPLLSASRESKPRIVDKAATSVSINIYYFIIGIYKSYCQKERAVAQDGVCCICVQDINALLVPKDNWSDLMLQFSISIRKGTVAQRIRDFGLYTYPRILAEFFLSLGVYFMVAFGFDLFK